jgi:hypothetical protein
MHRRGRFFKARGLNFDNVRSTILLSVLRNAPFEKCKSGKDNMNFEKYCTRYACGLELTAIWSRKEKHK